MAAIAPKWAAVLLALPMLAAAQANQNDNSAQADIARAMLNHVAGALTANNVSDAMTAFEPSFPDYQKLSNYFSGLTQAFYVSSEIDVLDEEDSADETKLSVRWALTLTDIQTLYTENRSAELNVRLVNGKGKWKIAALSPISLFDPAASASK